MKKNTILLFALSILLSLPAFGQEIPKIDASPLDNSYYPAKAAYRGFEQAKGKPGVGEPILRITYSRPSKNGRVVFGDLVKYGETWRLGANESAELLVLKEATIGNLALTPGRYTLYLQVEEKEWTLIVNNDLDGWGAYHYNAQKDVGETKATVEKTEKEVEAFSVFFTEDELIIAWDNSLARFPVKVKEEEAGN